MTKQLNADFIIHAGEWATVWGFEPQTQEAQEALDQIGSEDWQWHGDIFYTDHRPARQLAQYLSEDGFTLLHPKYGYFKTR